LMYAQSRQATQVQVRSTTWKNRAKTTIVKWKWIIYKGL
jgi:hypothetical protein